MPNTHNSLATFQAGILCTAYGVSMQDYTSPYDFNEYELWFGNDFDYVLDNILEDFLDDIESKLSSDKSSNYSEQISQQLSVGNNLHMCLQLLISRAADRS